LNEQVYSKLQQRPYLFIDLVNPNSRSDTDCHAMFECIKALHDNTRCVLCLNLNEADIIAGVIGIEQAYAEPAAVMRQTQAIRAFLGIHEVVTHGVSINCVAGDGYCADNVAGPHCAEPKKSTGAGDRFNAGYCMGLLLDVTPEQRLQLGVANSGFFIRNARSASINELSAFLEQWSTTAQS
jgi:sugar/nucleoside kinase (ribokinase family)